MADRFDASKLKVSTRGPVRVAWTPAKVLPRSDDSDPEYKVAYVYDPRRRAGLSVDTGDKPAGPQIGHSESGRGAGPEKARFIRATIYLDVDDPGLGPVSAYVRVVRDMAASFGIVRRPCKTILAESLRVASFEAGGGAHMPTFARSAHMAAWGYVAKCVRCGQEEDTEYFIAPPEGWPLCGGDASDGITEVCLGCADGSRAAAI